MIDHMTRRLASFAVALLACAGLQAATINTTLTVNATTALSGTNITATGTAGLTNIGNGTFSGTVSLTNITSTTVSAPFTITLSGGAGTITGTLLIPTTLLTGATSSGSGSATISGGTYGGGVTGGSFTTLSGTASGSLATSFTLNFAGTGTVITAGTGSPTGPTGPTGPPAPAITAVLDAGSYTKNIAQGSIFVVKGTNLSASGFTQLSFPLPTSSSGVKITFTPTTGGAGTDAYLVYLYNQSGVNQLAAVLPSTVAAGNYNVTVTNGSVSAPFAATVVARKLGLITADGSGTGLAVIQNFVSQSQLDIDRFTTFASGGYTFSPSRPGQVLIAWATGMGAVTGGDNVASPGFDFSKTVNVQVIVGGVSIAPLYAGRAPGLAGADQINFQLPANAPTGCIVSFQVSVNNVTSNPSFIAIAPDATSTACVQPGFTTAQLQQFDSGASRTIGSFSIGQYAVSVPQLGNVKEDFASGGFFRYTGFQLAGLAQAQSQTTSTGSCYVSHVVSSSANASVSTGSLVGLDAGAVTLTGPAGSGLTNQAFTQDPNFLSYSINLGFEGAGISLPGTVNANLVAGQYTITGAGGRDVGKFNASLTLGSPLTVTGGLPTSVTESAGLTLNWTGGNASDLVEIIGSSSTTTGTGTSASTDSWTFICTTTAGAGTFTVPASVLTQLPKITAGANGAGGLLEFASIVNPTSFTAPLTAGGTVDVAEFLSLVGVGAIVSYQ